MDYFISDTHFIHNNLLKFERRPFESVREHDDYILKLCEQLQETDTLYHLGDFVFCKATGIVNETMTRWKNLKCKKILIKGNHDSKNNSFYEEFFDAVYDTPLYYSKRIVLSHYPIPVTDGMINIHGHLHGSVLDSDNYINANIHIQNYQILSEKTVRRAEGKLKKDNYKFTYEWWAPKQKYIEKRFDDFPLTKDGFIDFKKLRGD